MATQAGQAAPSAPGAIDQLERLIGRFGAIAAVLAAIAGSAAALWTQIQPEIRWGVIGLAGVALLFVAVGKVVMPAIEARRRRKVIAIPDERLREPTTFRLRPYDRLVEIAGRGSAGHGGADQAARSRSVGERSRVGQPSTRRRVI